MSGTEPAGKDLSYDDIIKLKQKNEIILIDVREPSEIEETGKLPGSIHIPRKFLTFADSVSPGIHNPVGHALH
jgi:rhodanese-related sulfurtransferase